MLQVGVLSVGGGERWGEGNMLERGRGIMLSITVGAVVKLWSIRLRIEWSCIRTVMLYCVFEY